MASRLDLINKLAASAPIVDKQAHDQLQAGRELQLKAAAGQTPLTVPAHRAAQRLAPANATQAGQISQAVAQQTQQTVAGLGNQAAQAAGTAQQAAQQRQAVGQQVELSGAANALGRDLSRAEFSTNKQITSDEIASAKRVSALGIDQDNRLLNTSLKMRKELAAVGRDVKAKILDSRLQFERDEAGRKFSNERQLADYAVKNAQSEQELQSRMRDIKHASDLKVQILEHSSRQIMEALQRGWLTKEQKLDYEHKKALIEMKAKLDREIQKAKAKAANNMMIAQGVGMVAGAVIGGVATAGNPVGIAAGAQAGGSVGTLVYGATQ